MRETEPEAIDHEAFAELRETVGGEPYLTELVEMYVQDAASLVVTMRETMTVGRVHDLERAAHTLMGTSASLGANALSTLCRDLVALARTGALDGANERLAAIEAEVARVQAALRTLVQGV